MSPATQQVKCTKCGHVNPPGRTKCAKCAKPLPVVRAQPDPRVQQPGAAQNSMKEILFKRGQVVANRYTVLELIGRGGMGCIYKVRDNALDEEAALKTLLPQFVQDKMVVERFYNEARITRGLSHPGIVRVHDIGMAGKILYISMEYIRGESLRAMMDALPPGQRLDFGTVLRIFDELCEALEYAHQYTIHRDIKPENVMIAENGRVKLMDFGISKLTANPGMTSTSIVMGTPHYMSPEQLRDSAKVDVRADVYSVGVMLYEVVTGNVPTGVPKPASQIMAGLPPKVDEIIGKCLEPNPRDRYNTITELRRDLKQLAAPPATHDTSLAGLRHKPGAAHGAPKPDTEGGGLGRKLAGFALLLLILAGMAYGFYAVENRWQGLVDQGEAALAKPMDGADSGSNYEGLMALVDRARLGAEEAADADEHLAAVTAAAAEQAQRAREYHDVGDHNDAVAWAEEALRLYAALALRPEGMVYVPAGEVNVGGATVWVDGYYIDQHEVTVGEFATFMAEEDWPAPPGFDAGRTDRPVANIAFYDAVAYAGWAGKNLPTEAQWARAAHGKTGGDDPDPGRFPWGDEWEDGGANLAGDDDHDELAPVGAFDLDVSPFGVRDVLGNASEITRTPDGAAPNGETPPVTDIGFGDRLVVRGYNYLTDPQQAALNTPVGFSRYSDRYPSVGFRCVLAAPRDVATIRRHLAHRE